MKLYCIRHTKVDVPLGICYGQSDVGLADSYPEEMKLASLQLKGLKFDQIYSSPLNRCKTLAEDLFPNENLFFDDRLKELNFGDWEMKHWDEISKTEEAKQWFENFVNLRSPNGESFIDQVKRASEFLTDLEDEEYSSVILVVHGGIIRAINCLLNDIEPIDAFKTKVDYGEIMSFELK